MTNIPWDQAVSRSKRLREDERYSHLFTSYLGAVGLSKVFLQDPTAKEGLDDLCLVLYFQKKPSAEDQQALQPLLEAGYDGLWVYSKVVGKITPF